MNTVITYIDILGNIVSQVVTSATDIDIFDNENFTFYPGGFTCLRSDDEGITWMRGYFAPDSKEAVCMKVAHALAQKSDPYADNFI